MAGIDHDGPSPTSDAREKEEKDQTGQVEAHGAMIAGKEERSRSAPEAVSPVRPGKSSSVSLIIRTQGQLI